MFASLLMALAAAAGSDATSAVLARPDAAPAAHPQILPVRQNRAREADEEEPLEEARPVHPIVTGSTAGMAAMGSGVGIAGSGGVVGMVVGAVVGGACCVGAMCSSGCAATWGGMGMASGLGVVVLSAVLAVATFVGGPVMGLAGWAAAGIGRPRPSPWPLAVVGWAGTTLTSVLALIVGLVPTGVGVILAYQVYRDEQLAPFQSTRAGAMTDGEQRFLQWLLPLVSAGLLSTVVVTVLGLGATATLVGVVAALGIGAPTAEERAAAAEEEQRSSRRKPRKARRPRRPAPAEDNEAAPIPTPAPAAPVEPAPPPQQDPDVILPDQDPAAPTPDPASPQADPY